MKKLTKSEEIIMLTIWRLRGNAYGMAIKDQIKKTTGRDYMYSTLYTTLEQLVSKDYLSKSFGEPTPERGGKRKVYFALTETGLIMLKNAFQANQLLWQGVDEESFNRRLAGEKK